ncbi:MAG: hypothetical protein ACR2RF_06000 [Geminicoccaceae bacterium]
MSASDITDLTDQQREVLQHTTWRAANRMYCGDRSDPVLTGLCKAGLMKYCGTKAWLPETEGYFTITAAGIAALKVRDME